MCSTALHPGRRASAVGGHVFRWCSHLCCCCSVGRLFGTAVVLVQHIGRRLHENGRPGNKGESLSVSPHALHGAERLCSTIRIRSAREGYCAAQGEAEMIANARDLSCLVLSLLCYDCFAVLCLALLCFAWICLLRPPTKDTIVVISWSYAESMRRLCSTVHIRCYGLCSTVI